MTVYAAPQGDQVTVICFAASYAIAWLLELARLAQPRLIFRVLSVGFGAAGLIAHLIYLAMQSPSLATSNGSFLFLAFVLGVFWLYGSLHHRRVAWGVFVLPLVLGLIGLAIITPNQPEENSLIAAARGAKFWGLTHGLLLLFASVGVSVGFLASVMYFVQLWRLRSKTLPNQGIKLLSLERLELMNRRAILWAFPMLTLGLIVGVAMRVQHGGDPEGWTSPKIVSALGLWLVFAILLYLRYGAHVRGQRVAAMTIIAFVVLLVALNSHHPFVGEGTP